MESQQRCEGCKHWGQNEPWYGRCLQIRTIPGSFCDYLTHPTAPAWHDVTSRHLQTSFDFGCNRWEAKREP